MAPRSSRWILAPAAALAGAMLIHCGDEVTRYVSPRARDGPGPAPPEGGYVLPHAPARACDAGAVDCGTSFSTQVHGGVFVNLRCSSVDCHGPGAAPPTIDRLDASAARAALLELVLSTERLAQTPRPYVDPCAREPDASTIMCNLQGGCGVAMPLGSVAPGADLAVIADWLACGAPDN